MRLGRAQPFTRTHSYLRPPAKVQPIPLQREQTVRVTLAAIPRRVGEKRRFPLQGWEGSRTATTGFFTSTLGVTERLLGPEPPEVVLANVPLFVQKTKVTCVAVRTRRDLKRRVPPTWMEPAVVKTTGGALQTWGAFEYAIGPMPPASVLAQPSQRQQTINAWVLTQAERQRLLAAIKAKPRLLPIPPSPTAAAPVETTIRTHLVRRPFQRGAMRILSPPTRVGTFQPYLWSVAPYTKHLVPRRQDWRRYVLKILFAPAVVRPPFPVETTIHVNTVQPFERRARGMRGSMYSLGGPFSVPEFVPPEVGVTHRTLMGVGQ